MSKKHRLINKTSYYDKRSNRLELNFYKEYFYEDDLNDMELFELCIMLFHEKHGYDNIKWEDMVKQASLIDVAKVKTWFDDDLSSSERSRLSSSVNKLISAELAKRDLEDLSKRELRCFEVLCKITGGEIE